MGVVTGRLKVMLECNMSAAERQANRRCHQGRMPLFVWCKTLRDNDLAALLRPRRRRKIGRASLNPIGARDLPLLQLVSDCHIHVFFPFDCFFPGEVLCARSLWYQSWLRRRHWHP